MRGLTILHFCWCAPTMPRRDNCEWRNQQAQLLAFVGSPALPGVRADQAYVLGEVLAGSATSA